MDNNLGKITLDLGFVSCSGLRLGIMHASYRIVLLAQIHKHKGRLLLFCSYNGSMTYFGCHSSLCCHLNTQSTFHLDVLQLVEAIILLDYNGNLIVPVFLPDSEYGLLLLLSTCTSACRR
jgi:hypothetical protein